MNTPTVSEAQTPTMAEWAQLSERIEARLSRCSARCKPVCEQRTGSSHIVPRLQSVSAAPFKAAPLKVASVKPAPIKPARIKPARIKTPATPVRLPGLNGRSVRQLHHLGAVRVVRRALVSAIAAIAVIVGASMAVPAYAQATAAPPQAPPQVLTTPSTAVIATVERDGYTATPPPPVQWPTALHTKISDGYGPRVSPCDGCSSLHLAVDFDAGWGAEVHAMAAGVVIETNSSLLASLGNHMTIQHVIDGQVITSVYGHMQYGSTSLSVGDTVKVGQVIGLVGSTGASTGPHLHFEIRIDGEPVNPLDWLYARIG